MAKRRLTLKRIDPWSVLKFGFIANIALLAILLLGGAVVWFFIRRLGLIESVCEIAIDVGFLQCGVNGGNLFRGALLLGVLGVVVQTGVWVFLAFLHNLIADLVGGISFTYNDDSAAPTGPSGARAGGEPPSRTRRGEPGRAAPAGAGQSAPATTAAGGGARPPASPTGPASAPRTADRDDDIFATRTPSVEPRPAPGHEGSQ